MNDMDGKFVDWLKENQGSSTYSEFIQKTFSLTEQDINNMEPKKRKKRKKKSKSKSNRLFE
jgi:hypothetical protein